MSLLTSDNSILLWQDLIKHAENRCSITLENELEAYLVTLLARYANKPEMAKQVFATAFLEALHQQENQRQLALLYVGDQCLLFAGLFPKSAAKRQVKLSYFVDLGRSAYSSVSTKTNDLYGSLAGKFVVLMDVLQSIGPHAHLMPLEAYEQWDTLGSQRAFRILKEYSDATPYRLDKKY